MRARSDRVRIVDENARHRSEILRANGEARNAGRCVMTDSCEWETIDRTLRGLAEQRAKLDAEEAKWLRDAERIQIWRQFGCASLLDRAVKARTELEKRDH